MRHVTLVATAVTALVLILAPAQADERAERQYKALTLDNQLEVLLISDPELDRAAAALAIHAGAMDDDGTSGMAHFLEHMLFLGTEKYPEPGDYNDYLSANNGFSNAYTAENHTNYFFEVKAAAFEGAVDRFARFFIDPLLTDSLSARELNAVDSEHSKNLENDFWRARQVYRSLLNPKHPAATFSTGNSQTLAGVQNAALRAFYESHYSANLMHLVLVAPLPLETLEATAREQFSGIENRNLAALKAEVPLFGDAIKGKRVEIQTIQDIRQVWLRFEVDEAALSYISKPASIVGSILGHEGSESLLQQLKQEGLATGLSAGPSAVGLHQGTFDITITLTEQGLAQVDQVVERTFGMINKLRGLEAIPSHLIESEQKMGRINLRFRQPGAAYSEASQLTGSMIFYPHDNLLESMYLIQQIDEPAIRQVLTHLRPDNMVMGIVAKDRQGDQTEPHYGSNYRVTPLSEAFIAKLEAAQPVEAMDLPAPNPFIPSDFDLVATEHAETPLIDEFDFGELWLRHDAKFHQPKVAMRLEILNPRHAKSARDFMLGGLFAAAANEALNPFSYPMMQAGMSVAVSSGRGGLGLQAGGYSDKLPELLAFVTPFLTEVRIDEQKFEIIRTDAIRALQNKIHQPAQQHAFDAFRKIIREVHYDDPTQLAALESLTLEDLETYVASIHDTLYIRGFAYGNLEATSLKQLASNLTATLKPETVLPAAERYLPRVIKLAKGTSVIVSKEIESNDSAVVLMYQHDPLNDASRASLQVLGQIIRNKFFQDLRTLQQTGYIVGAGAFDVEDLPLFYFSAQSSVVEPASLRGRFESFILHMVEDMAELEAGDFESNRQAAMAAVLRKRKTFGEELGWNFRAAFELHGDFEEEARQAAALTALTQEQFAGHVAAFFDRSGVRRISIEMSGDTQRHRFQPSTIAEIREKAAGFWERPRRKAAADEPAAEPPAGASEQN